MKHLGLVVTVIILASSAISAQDRKIEFPDIPGYKTLVTDLHMHSVFSDGSVWPDIRVREALFDGVDAIAITEHLEYQPHREDIPHPDRNRAFIVAKEYAKDRDLIIIPGAEITRDMPPGHSNAIFIQDANKLIQEDSIEVFREAKRQGAFIFWNHPNWAPQRPDGVATLTELHKSLISEGLLNGIEVVNEQTFSDEAMAIAQENNLAILGTSDIHGLIDWMFNLKDGGHRPVTLVFSTDKSLESIKNGLEEGRTVVWNNNNLIGNKEYLIPLIESSLSTEASYPNNDRPILNLTIKNSSDARYILKNNSAYTFHAETDIVEVNPHSEKRIQVKTLEKLDEIVLRFEVLNAIEAPAVHPAITLRIEL